MPSRWQFAQSASHWHVGSLHQKAVGGLDIDIPAGADPA